MITIHVCTIPFISLRLSSIILIILSFAVTFLFIPNLLGAQGVNLIGRAVAEVLLLTMLFQLLFVEEPMHVVLVTRELPCRALPIGSIVRAAPLPSILTNSLIAIRALPWFANRTQFTEPEHESTVVRLRHAIFARSVLLRASHCDVSIQVPRPIVPIHLSSCHALKYLALSMQLKLFGHSINLKVLNCAVAPPEY